MVIVKAIFSNFLAFLMSFILTVLPSAPLRAPVIETLESDCLLNIEVLSDTHIQKRSPPLTQSLLPVILPTMPMNRRLPCFMIFSIKMPRFP